MKSAWQQMNANEQNDSRIVSANLYAIKNNFALNQLWLFWIDRHCCAELLLLLILLLISLVTVTALVSPPSLLHVPFLGNSTKWFGVSSSVQTSTTKVSKTMRREKKNTQQHPTHANERKLTGCLMFMKYTHHLLLRAHTARTLQTRHQASPSHMPAH